MRRVLTSVAVLATLVLLLAAPAAAAPPVRDSSTQTFVSAFSFECGPATCRETFVDIFSVSDETMVVCLSESTFNIRTGRIISQESRCSEEVSSDTLSVEQDLSSAVLSPTQVTFFECDEQGCVEGDTVLVSAELTASGGSSTDRSRQTFTDGTCTVTFTSSGESRQATGTVTIDGESVAVDGSIGSGKFTFMERCR
jgi:hypothetical protein